MLWPPQWPAHSPHVTFISSANKESRHNVYSQLAHCRAIQTVSEVREGTIVRENSENDGGGGWQCVTKPKIWTIPILFRYQIFLKPIPILFLIPTFFETDTDTFFDDKMFWNWYRYRVRAAIILRSLGKGTVPKSQGDPKNVKRGPKGDPFWRKRKL